MAKTLTSHFKENDVQLSIITEIWGKGSKKDLYKIQELLQMEGIELISVKIKEEVAQQ